jgi:hypothetical protein
MRRSTDGIYWEIFMSFKSTFSALLAGSSFFCALQVVAAPSSALTTICSNAFGVVEQKGAPTVYVESLTLQDMETKVGFVDGTSYSIWPNGYSGKQGGQADEIRSLVRFAYLNGYPVNVCVGSGAIWAIELNKNK